MTAQPLQDVIPRDVDAWNDPDPVQRRAKLGSVCAGDGRIVTQSGVFAGIDAVAKHVAQVLPVRPRSGLLHRLGRAGHVMRGAKTGYGQVGRPQTTQAAVAAPPAASERLTS